MLTRRPLLARGSNTCVQDAAGVSLQSTKHGQCTEDENPGSLPKRWKMLETVRHVFIRVIKLVSFLHRGWQRSTGKERLPAVGYHPEPKERGDLRTRLISAGEGCGQAWGSAAAQLSKGVAVPRSPNAHSCPSFPTKTDLIPYTHQHQGAESMGEQEQLYLRLLLAEEAL